MFQSRTIIATVSTAAFAALLTFTTGSAATAQRVTTPEQHFGHQIGADYVLPNYTAFSAYMVKVANESDRMTLDTIGRTAEGRPQLMGIITSPENHRNLERYRQIAQRLATAEGLTDAEARQLANEGKAVVWIDGGLHASEVLGAQQLTETVYQLISRNDDETQRILRDVIILAVHANPDGMELLSDWYMRNPVKEQRSTGGVPRLYQKYIGHDNNRDFFASTQPESENMNRVLYTEWYPQVMYNHHQTGPAGTVMFAPPFRDPFNYNLDPMIVAGLDVVGSAMSERFIKEGKGGVTSRSGASYSTWWNGGLRTTAYFHNMIGLLTETIGNPTPVTIPFTARGQLPRGDLILPVEPGPWKFRQSVDYSVTANYAVLDIVSRKRDAFLYNIYHMGKKQIENGNKDTWTTTPRRIEAVQAAASGGGGGGGRGGAQLTRADYDRMLRAPEMRNPRGYILSSAQPDFLTAAKLMDALMETGVVVHRATAAFTAGGKQYPAGSFVVKSAQAFRPHVLDMFEPQDHPDDIPYPGAAPTAPYDNAGWTLAMQMGVEYDRILDSLDGPFEKLTGLKAPRPQGRVIGSANAGYVFDPRTNESFRAANRLLAKGAQVFRLKTPFTAQSVTYPAGSYYVVNRGNARRDVEAIVAEFGINALGAPTKPAGDHTRLKPIRVALWDNYGGSMPSGWTRWIFEQFEVPFDVIYPPALDAGNLKAKYDAIVFVDGAIPGAGGGAGGGRGGAGGGGGGGGAQTPAQDEFAHMRGSVTAAKTIPQLREFMQAGGSVITLGSSTNLAEHFGLPITDAVVENGAPIARAKYYIPGSILQVKVDNTLPIAYGLGDRVDVFFDNSPVFKIGANAIGIKPIAWFDSDAPLRSGWAWGEHVLKGGIAMAQADIGPGKLFLFGPELLFRAQPHGTFKLVFNGLYATAGQDARIP